MNGGGTSFFFIWLEMCLSLFQLGTCMPIGDFACAEYAENAKDRETGEEPKG
ncbi:hypothetical protein PsW64_01760 [Pseudovibrio sp. W64]|nr:hypothetical protein PsW64_01760 [Pseudovibrio sp. W64]KZK87133.1 hypothetical protein PsAD13_00401 [Pseudovibrio sp. Ad13]KZK95353.1 hypothetical protein PsAD46_00357 [Pseudovibrio sp. Ad46]